jgi:Domain of unknown function (DUF4388)
MKVSSEDCRTTREVGRLGPGLKMARGISKQDSAPVVLRGAHTQSGDVPAVRYMEKLESEGADGQNTGFSATCQNTSLADWIQLIQMGRRDAIIVIRTPDHGDGLLWCRAGDIIDARWDPLTGEEAVYRILSFETGEVAVYFETFERSRAIHTSTTGLLLQAAYRRDSVALHPPASRTLPLPTNSTAAGNSTAPHVHPTPLLPRGRAPNLRPLLWAGPVTAALGLACWLSLRAGSGASPTALNVRSALVSPEAFLVHVEAQPDQAEIRLDDQLVATRALTTRLPRDGRLHKVLVSAPGYVPELITFRDQATVEGITLERPAPVAAEAARTRLEDPPSKARRGQAERRAPEPAPVATTRPATAALPPSSMAAPAPRPRIQIIDERQPWIQAIDDVQPRVKSIE